MGSNFQDTKISKPSKNFDRLPATAAEHAIDVVVGPSFKPVEDFNENHGQELRQECV
jgi:hypothetical protein